MLKSQSIDLPPLSESLQPRLRRRVARLYVELDQVRRAIGELNRRRARIERAIGNLTGGLRETRGLADACVAESMPRRLGASAE